MKEQRLMAFWKHDQYPYCLHGEVEEFCTRGLVRVKEYGGTIFRPLAIVLYEEGEVIARKLTELEYAHSMAVKSVRESYTRLAIEAAPFLEGDDE